MSRWWDRYGFRTILTIAGLIIALWLKQTQGGILSEAYYFVARPFQSQEQLTLEDRLTNARILELEQRVEELEQQNKQLKQLSNYNSTQGEKNITAPIIKRSRDRWWNKVTLGKGSKDGIKKGYIVMGIGGLVGRVTHTTPHTCKVLLISDMTSRVGAVLIGDREAYPKGNRQLGYTEGQDSATVVMKFFSQVTRIKPGDRVVTSNLSKLYPPGLPIGRVKPNPQTQGNLSEIEIELSAPMDILEWVNVRSFSSQL